MLETPRGDQFEWRLTPAGDAGFLQRSSHEPGHRAQLLELDRLREMYADPRVHPLSGLAARRRQPRTARDFGDASGKPERHSLLHGIRVHEIFASPLGKRAVRVCPGQRSELRPLLGSQRNFHGLYGAGAGAYPQVVVERQLQQPRLDLDRVFMARMSAPGVLVARREQQGDIGPRSQPPPPDPVLRLVLRWQVHGHPPGGGTQRRLDADRRMPARCSWGDRSGQMKTQLAGSPDRARIRAKVPEQEVRGLVEIVGPEFLCPDCA